ncbi:MAG: HDOD domain-containing protein [Dehalococcoidia bacterium]
MPHETTDTRPAAPGGDASGPRDPYAPARAELARRLARRNRPPEGPPSLDEVVAEVVDLRPLPQVATKILGLDEGRFSAHELAAIIASDQALTAKLLRLANSAYYGYARRITSVRDAVVLLGFRAVRGATLASCVMQPPVSASAAARAATPSNLDAGAFWQFSVATGMLAEVLACTEGAHRDDAFTAGVVHQIGVLALDQTYPAALRTAIEAAEVDGCTLHEAERRVLGFTDADVGGALAQHWAFPEPLVEAVRDYQRPLDSLPDPQSLTAFVLRARLFARSHGLADGLAGRTTPEDEATHGGEWGVPPLSVALRQSGGMASVMERVDAFLAATLV